MSSHRWAHPIFLRDLWRVLVLEAQRPHAGRHPVSQTPVACPPGRAAHALSPGRFSDLACRPQAGLKALLRVRSREAGIAERTAALRYPRRAHRAQTARLDAAEAGIHAASRNVGTACAGWLPSSLSSLPRSDVSGVPHALAHHTLPPHGGQLWRAKPCRQNRKHVHVLEHACMSANPSRLSSKKNVSLGG